jgi:DNA-binding response OmpR family regulator
VYNVKEIHYRKNNNIGIAMGKATLLIIEGKRADYPAFTSALRRKGFDVEQATSGVNALALLESGILPDAIIVDAASLRTTGKRICQSLRAKTEHIPFLLILEAGLTVESGVADVVLNLPFTVQKLVNRVKNVLPIESKKALHVGPIRLDVDQRICRCLGKRTHLTPRLIALLTILMQQHGEVIERKSLFSRVWETDYTEDTRTLDVHVSWLRRAIEVDPLHPRFLKTIRGVGYQLDL